MNLNEREKEIYNHLVKELWNEKKFFENINKENILCSVIWNISSDICIDNVTTDTESRYQVTTYTNIKDYFKWYTVILDHWFIITWTNYYELAKQLLDLEVESNSFFIIKK